MQLAKRHFLCFLLLLFYHYSVAQTFVFDSVAVDTFEQVKEVKPIEVSFLFSYYEQDGTKSPVTGGIGNEALADRVGNLTLNIPINNKIEFNFSGGIDVYSSASTDNINNEHGLYAETSASSRDERKYGNLGVLLNNEKRRTSFGAGLGTSHEYDVASYSVNASFSKLSKNRNTLLYFKTSAYNDKWKLYYPSELRWKYNKANQDEEDENPEDEDEGSSDGGSKVRNTFNGSVTIEQAINPRMNASITIEATYQNGLLSTPFHRIYFNDFSEHDIEKLPNYRLKIPVGIHLNYYVNHITIIRLFYRYYSDDFGIKAHTYSIELPLKATNSFTISPFYRFHTQKASKYFKPYGFHSVNDEYYTSDYDLANIKSNRVGMELKYSFSSIQKKEKKGKRVSLKKITLRGSKYSREREDELILKSFIVAIQLSFRID